MDKSILIEFIKIIIPAIISSGLVAYFFQKKLKRVGSYEGITKILMERMIQGIEDVFSKIRRINDDVLELEKLISTESVSYERLNSTKDTLKETLFQYKEALDAHRIYITSLIPMGGSSHYYDTYVSLVYLIDLYLEFIKSNDNQKLAYVRTKLDEQIKIAKELYRQACINITDTKKRIICR